MRQSRLIMIGFAIMLVSIVGVGCPSSGDSNGDGNDYVPSPPPPPAPAEFRIISINSPLDSQAGFSINVEVNVENIGGTQGTYNAILELDDVIFQSQEVELSAGESKVVTFAFALLKQGDYKLSVGDKWVMVKVLPIPLAMAVLTSQDFPSSFRVITPEYLGTSLAELSNLYAFDIGDEVHDFSGYYYEEGQYYEVAWSLNIYPIDTQRFDSLIGDSESFLLDQINRLEGLGTIGTIIPGSQQFGDKSIGIFLNVSTTNTALSEFFIRNGNMVTVLLVQTPMGFEEPVEPLELATILQVRIAAILDSW